MALPTSLPAALGIAVRRRPWAATGPGLSAALLFACADATAGGGMAGHGSWRWADASVEPVHSVTLFGGEGTEDDFTDTLGNLFEFSGSSDRIVALALGRRLAWLQRRASVDGEVFYARHYGRERYHEVGITGYVRWHEFPWSDHMVTSFAVGTGPSYTTIRPQLETQNDGEPGARLLNQFNLELTLASPRFPLTSMVVRLQHRSGVFGLFGGVTDASNFLTFGLRHEF